MKPLTANLKILYQCPIMWLLHFILLIGILFMQGPIYIGASLLFIFLYGAAISGKVAEILGKPFTFCLSDQTKTSQKFIFLVWLLIMLIYSLIMARLFFMRVKSDYTLFVVSAGLISLSYWLGVAIVLPIGGLIRIAFVSIIILSFPLNMFQVSILTAHPLVVALISGILICLIYRAIGKRENIYRLRNVSMPGNRFIQEPMSTSQDHRLDRTTKLISAFFSDRVRSNYDSMLMAHLWGQIYLIIGSLTTHWRAILIGGLCILIMNCAPLISPPQQEISQQNPGISWIFIITASAMGGGIFVKNRFDIFLLIGRKEYLWRGIVFLFSVILIISGLMATYALLSNLLSGSILPILFEGRSYLPSIRWILPVVPVFMIPLLGGLVIIFREGGIVLKLSMIVIAVAASLYLVDVMENGPFIFDLLIILSVTAITWGFHLAVLYYDSMKRSLC